MRALEIALTVAPRDLSVLIVGESGVGKEIIPRIIHDHSARKHNKYFAINCGSIPEGTIDSELFGHAKGAFTGAIGEREGYFGAANGGTLFLDEVGELPLATQARLLRVLETGEYIRVGESIPKKTNVRIVAATNVNIEKAIIEGKFRSDLYYRLNTIPITLPPLRERGKDAELLFRKFALDIADKYHCEPIRLTDDAKDLLVKYSWPGNIRQLRNLTEQLSAMFTEQAITSEELKEYGITDDSNKGSGVVLSGSSSTQDNSYFSFSQEREQIYKTFALIAKEIEALKQEIESLKGNTPSKPSPYGTQIQLPNRSNAGFGNEGKVFFGSSINESSGLPDDIETAVPYGEDSTPEKPLPLSEANKRETIEALKRNNYNRRMAAEQLGISERTLYRKLKEYGILESMKKTRKNTGSSFDEEL